MGMAGKHVKAVSRGGIEGHENINFFMQGI